MRASKRQRWIWLFAVVLAAIVAASVSRMSPAPADALLAVGFAVAFFAARLLPIRLPQGDEVTVTLMVAVVGYASLDAGLLLIASLLAGMIELLARLSQSSPETSWVRLTDALRAAAVLGFLSPWQLVLARTALTGWRSEVQVLLVLLAGISYSLVDVLSVALQGPLPNRMAVAKSTAALMRSLMTVYVVHVSMSAVVLRLRLAAEGWPFPVAVLLTLILQYSFNIYMRIRRAYSETIEALARAAELDRPEDAGHARRVADMSVAVARRLGLRSEEMEKVGYAALLHDVGMMGAVVDDSSDAHLRRGAQIVAAIPFLADVAPLISHEPEAPHSAPIGWSIVRACSQYDRLRSEIGVDAALDSVGASPELDPTVVQSLREMVGAARIGRQ